MTRLPCLALLGCVLAAPLAVQAQTTAPKDTVVIDRPTLLGYLLVAPHEIDSNPAGDMAATADDFAFYLGIATPTLDSLGVQVILTLDSTVVLQRTGHPPETFPVLGTDFLRVGYWLLQAGKKPRYLEGGVRSDSDLVQQAREYFRLARRKASR